MSEDIRAKNDKRWGYSSAGRAPALQAGGQEFDPPYLHQKGNLSEESDSYKTE